MLTAFNYTANIRELECSIVLHGAQMMSDETRYRAACILELLTGQRIGSSRCRLEWEDPHRRVDNETARQDMIDARSELMTQLRKGVKKTDSTKAVNMRSIKERTEAVAQEMRKLSAGAGLKLKTSMHGVRIWDFLEKARDFYLPDMVNGGQTDAEASNQRLEHWQPPMTGHSNSYEYKGLKLHWEKTGGSKRTCYPSRYPLGPNENPVEAITCYTLRSSDLLKFPDIELHFESLGPILGVGSNNETVRIIVRPRVQVTTPLDKKSLESVQPVETIRIMNYLLSQIFNAHLFRPHIG